MGRLSGRWPSWEGYRNVVSLMPNQNTPRATSPLRQVEAYWAALPRPDGVPRRSDVDPRGLENLLEYAFILERVAPTVARFRVAGQHLARLAGMEVRGMPLTALFGAPARADLGPALERVFDAPAVLEATLAGSGTRLARAVHGEMLILPLAGETGEVSRALGAIMTDAKPGGEPQKLGTPELRVRPIHGIAPASHGEPTRAFAEGAAPFRGARQNGRPALRVVHSAD